MSLLTSARNTPFKDSHGIVIPMGVEASTVIYMGALVCSDDNGYAAPAQPKGSSPFTAVPKVMGVAIRVVDGEFGEDCHNVAGYPMIPSPPNLGSAGALLVEVRKGVVLLDISGSTIGQAQIGSLCYAVDDHTVSNTDATQTQPVVGMVVALESGMVWVDMNVQSLLALP